MENSSSNILTLLAVGAVGVLYYLNKKSEDEIAKKQEDIEQQQAANKAALYNADSKIDEATSNASQSNIMSKLDFSFKIGVRPNGHIRWTYLYITNNSTESVEIKGARLNFYWNSYLSSFAPCTLETIILLPQTKTKISLSLQDPVYYWKNNYSLDSWRVFANSSIYTTKTTTGWVDLILYTKGYENKVVRASEMFTGTITTVADGNWVDANRTNGYEITDFIDIQK